MSLVVPLSSDTEPKVSLQRTVGLNAVALKSGF